MALGVLSRQPLVVDTSGNILPLAVDGNPLNLPSGSTVGGVAIGTGGGGAWGSITGSLTSQADLAAALGAKAAISESLSQFTGGSYAYRDLKQLADDSIDSRISGLTAGTSAQNLFSTRDDSGSGTYVRSTTWFGHDVDFTPVIAYNDSGDASKNGVAISPRHVLFAYHTGPSVSQSLRFITAAGTVVTRTISSLQRVGSTDIYVGKLSSDLPSNSTGTGIGFAYVLKSDAVERAVKDAGSNIRAATFITDQNQKAYVAETTAAPSSVSTMGLASSSPRSTFWKSGGFISGDSGHPMGLIVDGKMVVLALTHAVATDSITGDSIAHNYAGINSAMTSLGGGYQLTPLNITPFVRNDGTRVDDVAASGDIPVLDATGKIPLSLIPAFISGSASSLADGDDGSLAMYSEGGSSANWTVANPSGFRTAISLGNVDNTSDHNKDVKGLWDTALGHEGMRFADTTMIFADGISVDVSDTDSFRTSIGVGSGTDITFKSLGLGGTAGAGFIDIPAQSSPPSAPAASHIRIFNTSANKFGWIGASGFVRTFDGTLTASRTFTLPDADTKFPISAQILTFSGPAAARTFTLPDSNATLLYSGGALGTPSSGTLTSATGLPIGTGVSGLGTGVATALAVANNSAGGYSPIDGTATLSNKTLTAPKFASGGFIADANGNEQIIFTTTASAVNELTLANAATGGHPTLSATGGDSNVNIVLTPKGTGYVEDSGGLVVGSNHRIAGDQAIEIYTTLAKARARTVSGRGLTLDRAGLHMASGAIISLASVASNNDATDTFTGDTGLSRISAGLWGFGTGATGSFAGRAKLTSAIYAGTTIAALNASPTTGEVASVTDGDSSLAWGATVMNSGSGTTKYLVWWNGVNWTVCGK